MPSKGALEATATMALPAPAAGEQRAYAAPARNNQELLQLVSCGQRSQTYEPERPVSGGTRLTAGLWHHCEGQRGGQQQRSVAGKKTSHAR